MQVVEVPLKREKGSHGLTWSALKFLLLCRYNMLLILAIEAATMDYQPT
jgi:hypothetical protein